MEEIQTPLDLNFELTARILVPLLCSFLSFTAVISCGSTGAKQNCYFNVTFESHFHYKFLPAAIAGHKMVRVVLLLLLLLVVGTIHYFSVFRH